MPFPSRRLGRRGAAFSGELPRPAHAYQQDLPESDSASDEDIARALTRSGVPQWHETEFLDLLALLRRMGFGWIDPEGVRQNSRKWRTLASPMA